MNDEAVREIKALTERGLTFEIKGKHYSPVNLVRIGKAPLPNVFKVSTLSSLAEYLNKKIDHADHSKLFLLIDSVNTVLLSGHLTEEMERVLFVSCELPRVEEFPFGHFQNLESFLIGLRTKFKPSADRDKLMSFCSKITSSASLQTADDGVTQNIEIKASTSGVLKANGVAPSLVELAPFRTFREVEQPASEFIFRMRGGSPDQAPTCALLESDGGAWRLQAIENVSNWLKKKTKGITVLS